MRVADLVVILQRAIAAGQYHPGERIPTRQKLENSFGASSVTVQRATEVLIASGFLEVRGKRGTFVAANPPSLRNFVLMLPRRLDEDVSKNAARRNFAEEARKISDRDGVAINVFDGYMDWRNIDRYNRLVTDFGEDRLAGVIFIIQPRDFVGTPLLDNPNIARVAIDSRQMIDNVPVVFFDTADFFARAMKHLRTAGSRNPAYIGSPQEPERIAGWVNAAATGYGLKIAQENIQSASLETVEWGYLLAKLMFGRGKNQRPDGLIIGDDNLVPPVTRALKELGIRKSELTVVAYANYPLVTQSFFPALRLGVKVEHLMRACLECLLAQKDGGGWRSLSKMENFLPVEVIKDGSL